MAQLDKFPGRNVRTLFCALPFYCGETMNAEAITPFLEAFQKSSDRTRAIYAVVLAFSVVSSATVLNTSSLGWHRAHLEKAKLVYEFFDSRSASPTVLVPIAPKDAQEAAQFARQEHIWTLEDAKDVLANDEREVTETDMVQVPVFGTAFDVRDIGLVSGISLIVLMAILSFSLSREITDCYII